MKINLLDSSVYNRISAGEVVENPASVVKELMENAVDAGASNLTVSIMDGGIKSIEVSDDGCGIPKEELRKTILPHATSKIATANDLDLISTLGFRGEALASISAVSDFEIRSRYIDSDCGAFLKFKNGESEIGDVAIERGTTVIVRNLFFNTPARYKFLGSKSVEETAVGKLIFKFILANPGVAVRYYADDTLIYSSGGTGLQDAIDAIFPQKIAESFIELQPNESDAITVSGYITPPDVFKNNKSMQTVVLNGRIIVDQTISATIQNAYGSRLMTRCFPVYVLNIVMPFDDVDVNVHPSKKEVRFAHPRSVYGKIYNAVCRALDSYEFEKRHNLMAELTQNSSDCDVSAKTQPTSSKQSASPLNNEIAKEEPALDILSAISLISGTSRKSSPKVSESASPISLIVKPEKLTIHTVNAKTKDVVRDAPSTSELTIDECVTAPDVAEPLIKPSCKVIGQIFGTYLAIESGEKLLLIDQHAMHERILFDKFVGEIEANEVPIQSLMIPYIYESTNEKISLLLKSASALRACGFEISEFGSDAIKIDGVPAILAEHLDVIDCFNSITEELALGKQKLTVTDIGKDRFASMACKAAIKGNTEFDPEQIALVMDYFTKGSLPLQCPHGRPTAVIYTKSEFEKMFRRKV